MANQVLELVKAGVITMRLITLIIVGVAIYMWTAPQEMTEVHEMITVMVIVFYFGGETMGQFAKYLLEKYIAQMGGK